MALPANVGKGIVGFKFLDSNGEAAVGTITFTPEFVALKNVTANPKAIILPKKVTVTLNAQGAGSANLMATTDPDNNPVGWTYRVTANLEGLSLVPFSIQVSEGTTTDLANLQPLLTSTGAPMLVGEGVPFGGATGYVLAKRSPADYDTEWVEQTGGGGGGGAVDSVNGQTGVVVLDAADVNARAASWVPTWGQVSGKPSTFPPAAHDHNGVYSPVGHNHTGVYAPVSHNHNVADVNFGNIGEQVALTNTYAQLKPILANAGSILQGDDLQLFTSDDFFLNVHVPDDGTPSSNWPDRFAFYFEDGTPGGRRTGYFNEYGELRARPAKDNTVGFRSMPHPLGAVDQEFFQVSGQFLETFLAVSQEYVNFYLPMRHAPSDTVLANTIVIDEGESVPVGTIEGSVVVLRPL